MPTATDTNGAAHEANGVHEVKIKVSPSKPENGATALQTALYTSIIEHPDANYNDEVAALPISLSKSPSGLDAEAFRAWLKGDGALLPRHPLSKRFRPEVEVKYADIPISYGDGDEYLIRVHDPGSYPGESTGPRPALVFYHGGGWIHGDAAGDHEVANFFASELRAVVFNVDYRLAPEHPFPAALNDSYHSVGWVIENAEKYNVDTSRIAMWGCSSGGNLAAAVAFRDAIENTRSRIRHVNLFVPVTCHPSYYPPPLTSKLSNISAEERALIPEYLNLWKLYAPHTPDHKSPYASPLLHAPPPHHPSTHIAVAGLDFLRDEGIAYAIHLRGAGVDTQLEVIPGVPHGLTFAPAATVARQFFRDQVRVLNAALWPSW